MIEREPGGYIGIIGVIAGAMIVIAIAFVLMSGN
jgi:hypothetical protein